MNDTVVATDDEDNDPGKKQDRQEELNAKRNRVNAWRKANPEKAAEIAKRQYLKRKAAGKLKRASRESAAASRRKYNESKKLEVQRLHSVIEDLKIEVYELEHKLTAVDDLEAKLAIAISWLKTPDRMGQDADVAGAIDEQVRKNASKHST
jgi:protein-tyrosine phosphatase